MLNFLREVRSELAKVSFPTRTETIRLTAIVIAISAVVALVITFYDLFFIKLINLVIG